MTQRTGFRVPLIGLEVERKTDLLALTAFVLALAGVLYQLLGYVRGAEVELFAPEQVVLVAEPYGDDKIYLRINARMAYVNSGQPGFNAAVRRETVSFSLGNTTYEQVWQAFQSFNMKGKALEPHFESDAKPVPVSAGSAESHETYFAPHPARCGRGAPAGCDTKKNYLEWSRFIVLAAQQKQMSFEFVADVYGESRPKTSRCIVDLDDDLILTLTLYQWAAPLCAESTADRRSP